MKRYTVLMFYFAMIFNFGCMSLSSNSRMIDELKYDIAQIQIQNKEIQQECIGLHAKVDSVLVITDIFNVAVQDLQNSVSILNQTLSSFGVATNIGKDNFSDCVLLSSLYRTAYADYSAGKFELAYSELGSFVNKYPNSEYASQAQFYMGECFYCRCMWEQAVDEYVKIEQQYKESNLIPSARLKIALCYEMLEKYDDAENIFLSIISHFPNSHEVSVAKEKIRLYKRKNVQAK
ncbi:MAG: tetratricopeptide repeat protein [Endomicrobium sp.]|nr:tetratricopeptide repeat protein [Endomicrobium sp.]